VRIVAFINNKGGVGQTSLVYHLAWMYADLGCNAIAADLDPQANLTGMFLEEDRIEELWPEDGPRRTVYGALRPLLDTTGDVAPPHVEEVAPGLGLVVGDLALSAAEDGFSSCRSDGLGGEGRAFRLPSALRRVLSSAAEQTAARVVLLDVGPTVGAFNRGMLPAADFVVVPLSPDLYSLEGLRILGPKLRRWRSEWAERRECNPVADPEVPEGAMKPIGYVVMQHAARLDKPARAYARWTERVPNVYREAVLAESPRPGIVIERDPDCLAALGPFSSLMPLAREARKPMFALKPADGAVGGHAQAVRDCYRDFRALARKVAERCRIPLP